MRYYVKRLEAGEIEGPFSVEELNHRVAKGSLRGKDIASSDVSDGIKQLAKVRPNDWFQVANIPGIECGPAMNHSVRDFTLFKIAVWLLILVVLALVIIWLFAALSASGLSDA